MILMNFLQGVGADRKLVDISYSCLSAKTSWNWSANKPNLLKFLFMFTYIFTIFGDPFEMF